MVRGLKVMVKAIDLQVTLMLEERGPAFKIPEVVQALSVAFRSMGKVLRTEKEMVEELRKWDVKAVVVAGGLKIFGWTNFDEIKEGNDYVGSLLQKYPDVFVGAWMFLDPDLGWKGLKELERCIDQYGFYGVAVGGALTGVPANDKRWYPFYELCEAAKVPIKIWVGHLAYSAAMPGGEKIRLYSENPIPFVDDVAAEFPKLTIICAHHPWPFHNEMISVLIHKPNVYNEQHGWSPKYFDERFKRELNSRIQDKVMFGSDYPFFSYERLFNDWESQGFKPEVLEKVYWKNAARVLNLKL